MEMLIKKCVFNTLTFLKWHGTYQIASGSVWVDLVFECDLFCNVNPVWFSIKQHWENQICPLKSNAINVNNRFLHLHVTEKALFESLILITFLKSLQRSLKSEIKN